MPITVPVCLHLFKVSIGRKKQNKTLVWHDRIVGLTLELGRFDTGTSLSGFHPGQRRDPGTASQEWPGARPIKSRRFASPYFHGEKKGKARSSPWVPITPNDSERMEHMQIVPRYHCHAKHKAWSFITPVVSCTPPWAQTMNPGPSSMLLFVFNCQEKENKSPVTRRCECAAVSCKQNVRVSSIREETPPAVLQSSE